MNLRSASDVIAVVPFLCGFHPVDSLVVLAFGGAGQKHLLTTRIDLPPPECWPPAQVDLLRREGAVSVVVVGYGTGVRVTPAVDSLMAALRWSPIEVKDALRVEDGRYWSYLCDNPSCCPPEGVPYTALTDRVAALATAAGLVALPNRAALEGELAPVDGRSRAAIAEATRRIGAEIRASIDSSGFAERFVRAALGRVRSALEMYAGGRRLSDEDAVRLGIELTVLRVRDDAWLRILEARWTAHEELWTDLTRRLEPRFVPPTACLLAVTRLQQGDGARAGIALDRALAADPSYSMAVLLVSGLRAGLAMRLVRDPWGTPQQLEAAMGPPVRGWLQPLACLLDEPGPDP